MNAMRHGAGDPNPLDEPRGGLPSLDDAEAQLGYESAQPYLLAAGASAHSPMSTWSAAAAD